jgi:hypothetical protein
MAAVAVAGVTSALLLAVVVTSRFERERWSERTF